MWHELVSAERARESALSHHDEFSIHFKQAAGILE
jgi:hypothetical protein